MPQSTDELREEWGTTDKKAIEYLESCGWVRLPNWTWTHPFDKDPTEITEKEQRAIIYLIQEWDWGGIA